MARKKDKKKTDDEMGWDAEDADEAKEAEAMLGKDMDQGKVYLKDTDKRTAGIETYDEDTGQLEGTIILKDGNTEGLLALVKIIEQVGVEQTHDAEMKSISFSGKLEVENPSEVDRLWDIDITLNGTEVTNLKSDQIKIRELGVTEEDKIYDEEFQITGDAKNLLLIKEYINTLPDADSILNIRDIENDLLLIKDKDSSPEVKQSPTDEDEDEDEVTDDDEEDYDADGGVESSEAGLEAFAISKDVETSVYFALAMRSLFEKPLTNVKVTKNIPEDFSNPVIVDTSLGMAEIEGDQIVWTIDELEPESTVMLKFTLDILVDSIDTRRTGTVEVSYEAASSFAGGLSIGKFDAYTRNRFYVDTLERDAEPGVWDCSLVFENSSEFVLELFNADVYAPEDPDTKLIDIDPNDVPSLPAGAQWHSVSWQYESEDFPAFRKKLEFRVMPDFQTIVNGTIVIDDVELSIASIVGDVIYSKTEITDDTERVVPEEGEEAKVIQVPTYQEKDVFASIKLHNDGSAPLNEVTFMHQIFTTEFSAPTAEEIRLIIDGGEVELADEAVTLEGDVLKIILKDLKEGIGMFEPDSVMEVRYPIHCINPAQEARFESEIVILANTFPVSQELQVTPLVPVIEAIHVRRKFRIGKEVLPIGSLGEYQIILTVENIGNSPLQNLILLDAVPDNFEYSNYSLEPQITDEIGKDTLKWELDEIQENERLEISYNITGSGEYSPSDAQLAL